MVSVFQTPLDADTIKEKARALGADLVGIADGAVMDAHPPDPRDPRRPKDITEHDGGRVIVLAKRYSAGTTRIARWDERHKYYNDELVLTMLEETSLELVFWLEDNGYPAIIIPPTHADPWLYRGDSNQHMTTVLSLTHAAVEAGLGTLGLNLQLITPEFGPRVLVTAVLCSVDCETDERQETALCLGPECGRCLTACPGDVVGHWERDWPGCDRYRSPHGFSQLAGHLGDILEAPDDEARLDLIRSETSFNLWQSILRGAGVISGCRRCQDVCPVGADYARMIGDSLDEIPEATPEKAERLAVMAEAEAAEQLPTSYEEQQRWIGALGYRGSDLRGMSVLETLAGGRPDIYAELPLCIPESPEEIDGIQRRRKRIAVERARRSSFWRPRLEGIDANELDDPGEWSKIPILTKDQLRAMTAEQFYEEFCTLGDQQICEYWRSGGSTGKPLFYPKTFEDILFNMVGFTRTFAAAGIDGGENERAHISTPLGVHPVGHMWARAAQIMRMGAVWAGSGASLPSVQQLALISSLKPTVWMGMSSYGLHLANLANTQGIDLAGSSVSKMLCSAEALSEAKRRKLERDWGATVFDCFGMTEISMLAAEGPSRQGFRIWTDLAIFEVLDPDTGKPVADGEPGHLVCTSLFGNNGAPFLRWDSGDIVIMNPAESDDGAFSVFPTMRHAHRTAGFFKLRGVNVNHQEFEDMMFGHRSVNDFKLELIGDATGLEHLRVSVEPRRGADADALREDLARRTKATFELSPDIVILEPGVLAREFEASVKAPRFIDRRQ